LRDTRRDLCRKDGDNFEESLNKVDGIKWNLLVGAGEGCLDADRCCVAKILPFLKTLEDAA